MFSEPLAYFLTWNTYGTWLPGDTRGWVEYGRGWRMPNPILERETAATMTADGCRLGRAERLAVEDQIAETCEYRGWTLYAVNCRSNHVHVVLAAPETAPKTVRSTLKAWSTRRLKAGFDPQRVNWWAERGSVRFVFDEQGLEAVIVYTREGQDGRQGDA